MNTKLKNIATLTLSLILALAVACDSPLSQEDSNKQMTEMSVLAVAGALTVTSVTTPIQGSCVISASSCVDYHTGWTSGQMTTDCNTAGGTITIGGNGCTAVSRIASCALSGRGVSTFVGGVTASARYFPPTTLGQATTACNSVGGTIFSN